MKFLSYESKPQKGKNTPFFKERGILVSKNVCMHCQSLLPERLCRTL
ncbi:hypothetical protein CHCC15087_3480 [Bacillus licheniformis]|nr:hypothetical protein CHCC15087_3480 [Bacillus licheniformis]